MSLTRRAVTTFNGKRRGSHAILMIVSQSLLLACAGPATVDLSVGHNVDPELEQVHVPPIVAQAPVLPRPKPAAPVETYTVVVKDVPVVDLLFSLARDAGLELDIQAQPDKTITINAVEQPLQKILSRISDQALLRYQINGKNLLIQDDSPYWHNYLVNYVNVSRDSTGEVGVATEIATSGGSVSEESNQQGSDQGNLSKTIVKNVSKNDFWTALEYGLISLLSVEEAAPSNTPESNNPVIVNAMAGVATVSATQRQHRRIQKYLDTIIKNSQRQVLIEMTIVEVELSDKYQAGVDWQRLSDNAGLGSNGISVTSDLTAPGLGVAPFVALDYTTTDANGSNVAATVRLLQQFGDTKVLSSPKIMALNNQTALLKVVNERVYFTIELDIRDATADIPERRTFTSEIHTVPVGLVLSVTPQISNDGYVSLNIRPTISRITGFAVDPAPRLADADFDNLIPEIQVREIESLLQVLDGRTVVLGGLMQNEQVSQKDGVPGLSRIPKIGKLFSYTRDDMMKTELVIFLKPTVINNASGAPGAPTVSDYYQPAAAVGPAAEVEYR